jgi:hypothetical protein
MTCKTYRHRTQMLTNRILEYMGSPASASSVFRNEYLDQDTGRAFRYVTRILRNVGRPIINSTLFHIVNACSPFSGLSYGRLPPPPGQVIDPGTNLCLTFALRRNYYLEVYDAFPCDFKIYKQRYIGWSYVWGEAFHDRYDYLTVNLRMTDAAPLHLEALLTNNLKYLYNVLGITTKNYVKRYRLYDKDVYGFYRRYDLHRLYERLYHMSFPDLANRYPVFLWMFNRFFWEQAINLTYEDMINEYSALYYFLYVRDDMPQMERVIGDRIFEILFDKRLSFTAILAKSLERFFGGYDHTEIEALDLVLPAALYGKRLSGSEYRFDLTRYLLLLRSRRDRMIERADTAEFLSSLNVDTFYSLAERLTKGDTRRLKFLM